MKGKGSNLLFSKRPRDCLAIMYECKGIILFVCWKPLKGVTSFSVVGEIFREAHKSEIECRCKTDEVTLSCTAPERNPQLWIQCYPVNII